MNRVPLVVFASICLPLLTKHVAVASDVIEWKHLQRSEETRRRVRAKLFYSTGRSIQKEVRQSLELDLLCAQSILNTLPALRGMYLELASNRSPHVSSHGSSALSCPFAVSNVATAIYHAQSRLPLVFGTAHNGIKRVQSAIHEARPSLRQVADGEVATVLSTLDTSLDSLLETRLELHGRDWQRHNAPAQLLARRRLMGSLPQFLRRSDTDKIRSLARIATDVAVEIQQQARELEQQRRAFQRTFPSAYRTDQLFLAETELLPREDLNACDGFTPARSIPLRLSAVDQAITDTLLEAHHLVGSLGFSPGRP